MLEGRLAASAPSPAPMGLKEKRRAVQPSPVSIPWPKALSPGRRTQALPRCPRRGAKPRSVPRPVAGQGCCGWLHDRRCLAIPATPAPEVPTWNNFAAGA